MIDFNEHFRRQQEIITREEERRLQPPEDLYEKDEDGMTQEQRKEYYAELKWEEKRGQ